MSTSADANCDCVFTTRHRESLSRPMLALSWFCRITAAVILLQTLYFKFTGAEESIYIFSTLGIEPWGRYASGVVELFAAVFLLLPRTVALGALTAAGVMIGAMGSHLTKLGLVVKDDGGLLFALAVVVFTCASVAGILHRRQISVLGFHF